MVAIERPECAVAAPAAARVMVTLGRPGDSLIAAHRVAYASARPPVQAATAASYRLISFPRSSFFALAASMLPML